jgi:three-Cys-motif partner protein
MLDDDGLPLDEVGPWAKEKHERLRRYVDISRQVRRKFLPGGDTSFKGGATYIDLYCGSGRAIIRDSGERIDGSPLVAFKCARDRGVPFSQIYIADDSEERCRAAAQRIANASGTATPEVGPAEETVIRISQKLNRYGLHFAFLDPYNLNDLPFSVIETLGSFRHIDMLIHLSVLDLQRNLDAYSARSNGPLDRFAPGWRNAVDLNQSQQAVRAAYIAYWASKFDPLGLSPARHAELVLGPERNQRLYWLVFASKEGLANEFWDKIRNLSGQGEFDL